MRPGLATCSGILWGCRTSLCHRDGFDRLSGGRSQRDWKICTRCCWKIRHRFVACWNWLIAKSLCSSSRFEICQRIKSKENRLCLPASPQKKKEKRRGKIKKNATAWCTMRQMAERTFPVSCTRFSESGSPTFQFIFVQSVIFRWIYRNGRCLTLVTKRWIKGTQAARFRNVCAWC